MAAGLLAMEGRISYRRLKAEFDLDDAGIEALRCELIEVKRLAVDLDGVAMGWAGVASTVARVAPPALRVAPPVEPAAPPANDSAPPQEPAAAPIAGPVPNDAERRPLTVMFCDLADSTALSASSTWRTFRT